MSTEKASLNRTEVRVFIVRNYRNIRDFCEQERINYNSFLTWLRGSDLVTYINDAVLRAAERLGYDIELLYQRAA